MCFLGLLNHLSIDSKTVLLPNSGWWESVFCLIAAVYFPPIPQILNSASGLWCARNICHPPNFDKFPIFLYLLIFCICLIYFPIVGESPAACSPWPLPQQNVWVCHICGDKPRRADLLEESVTNLGLVKENLPWVLLLLFDIWNPGNLLEKRRSYSLLTFVTWLL